MRPNILVLALLAALAAPAIADEGDKTLLDELRDRRAAQEKSDAPPPAPVAGVRYRVALHSGRTFYGIRRGPLYVRWQNGAYVETEPKARRAGVRLFFPRGQNGFVVIRMALVAKVEEVGEISVKEGIELSRGFNDMADRAENERAELRAERERLATEAEKAKLMAEAVATDEKEETAEDADAAKLAEFMQLLVRFPPGTWTLETPDQIAHRRVIMGIAPSEEDMAFLEVFDAWKDAYATWKQGQGKSDAAGGDKQEPKPEQKKPAAAGAEAAARPAPGKASANK